MSTSVGERSHLERNKSEGGASTSRNVPAGSASGPPNAAGPLSPPVLGKCCYGVLAYSRKHYDAGLEPVRVFFFAFSLYQQQCGTKPHRFASPQSCVGVKVSSDHLNPPRGDQGEAWGNFRYSCMGYSVYRATRGHKDGAVDLPSCEFGVEVRRVCYWSTSTFPPPSVTLSHLLTRVSTQILATATSNDEKQDRAATGARAAVERPGRGALGPRNTGDLSRPPRPLLTSAASARLRRWD